MECEEEEVLFYENYDLHSIVTPVNIERFHQLLIETGYNHDETQFVVDGFTNGFDIGYQGKEDVRITSENLKF